MADEAVTSPSASAGGRPAPGASGTAGRPAGTWVVALATFPVLYIPVAILFVVWDGDWRTVAPALALVIEFPLAIFAVMAHAARFGERVVFRRGLFVLAVGTLTRALFILAFVWGQIQSAG